MVQMRGRSKRSARIMLVKTLIKGKRPIRGRIQAVRRALRIGRIRCRRSKDIAKAQLCLVLFEKAMTKMEADPAAMREFRAKRIPELEGRIRAIDAKIQELVRKAQDYSKQRKTREARKLWREEDRLSAVRKALGIELQMFKELLNS